MSGSNRLYFDADSGFVRGEATDIRIYVTYEHDGNTDWVLEYQSGDCKAESAPVQDNDSANNGLRTAVFSIPAIRFDNAFDGKRILRFTIAPRQPHGVFRKSRSKSIPTCGDGQQQVGEECDDGNTVTERCDRVRLSAKSVEMTADLPRDDRFRAMQMAVVNSCVWNTTVAPSAHVVRDTNSMLMVSASISMSVMDQTLSTKPV